MTAPNPGLAIDTVAHGTQLLLTADGAARYCAVEQSPSGLRAEDLVPDAHAALCVNLMQDQWGAPDAREREDLDSARQKTTERSKAGHNVSSKQGLSRQRC